jgi:hypothetical protein
VAPNENKNVNANENNRDIPDAALRQQIQERAYHIWLENGCGHGYHERHWFQAERELMDTAKQEREQRSDVRNGKKPVNRINQSDKGRIRMKNQPLKEKEI